MAGPPKIKPFSGRVSIPPGYLLGRTKGQGPAELISFEQLRAPGANFTSNYAIAIAAAIAKVTALFRNGVGFYVGGLMANGELLGACVFEKNITFTTGDTKTICEAEYATTATTVLEIAELDYSTGIETDVGTITFTGAGAKLGVVAWTASPYTLVAGKILELYAPAVADITLSHVAANINGAM